MNNEEIIKASKDEIAAQINDIQSILSQYRSGLITPFELANKVQSNASSIVRELISIGETAHR